MHRIRRARRGEEVNPSPVSLNRLEDPPYLDWLRLRRCAECKRTGRIQRLRTEPHHIDGKGMGGARCRDDRCVPLCHEHHMASEGRPVPGVDGVSFEKLLVWAEQYRERYLREKLPSNGMVPW